MANQSKKSLQKESPNGNADSFLVQGVELITVRRLEDESDETYDVLQHWLSERCLKLHKIKGKKRFLERQVSLKRCGRIRELQNERHMLANIARILDKELPYKLSTLQ